MQNECSISVPWWTDRALRDHKTDTFWITGGLGSGKTYGSTIWFLDRVFQNLKSKFSWAIAPTHSKVRDILIPTFHEILDSSYNLKNKRDYEVFITQPPKLVFRDFGHEVHFHSGARPDLMIGTNISHYLITEAGTQKEEVFIKAQTRTRCPKAKVRQGLSEGTPEGMNWYEQQANFGNGQPDVYNSEKHARRFTLWTHDNPHLPADYVDKLKRTFSYDTAKLESYLYGRFVPFTKGTAYWEFVDSRNVTRGAAKDNEYLPLLFCWDFNKNPLAWVVMQRHAFEQYGQRKFRFVAIAESDGKSRGILDACARFIERFPPHIWKSRKIEIYGDPSGYAGSHLSPSCSYDQILQALASRYENVSIEAARKAPVIRDRLERVNALLVYGQYLVSPECKNLIRSHTMTSLKEGTWEFEKPKGDDWTHWADATGYPLFQLTKAEDLETPVTRILGTNA